MDENNHSNNSIYNYRYNDDGHVVINSCGCENND
jgi:hypothetical protein